MHNQENIKFTLRINAMLWLSTALFIFGLIETTASVEFLPEPLKSSFTGPVLIVLGVLLFVYPFREIKKVIQDQN